MEFSFRVNHVLVELITVVTADVINPYKGGIDRQGTKSSIREIIDKMGIASAKAQKLNNVISSAALLLATDHRIYLIKDGEACDGQGAVIGILKVGVKKLWIVVFPPFILLICTLYPCLISSMIKVDMNRIGIPHQFFCFFFNTILLIWNAAK